MSYVILLVSIIYCTKRLQIREKCKKKLAPFFWGCYHTLSKKKYRMNVYLISFRFLVQAAANDLNAPRKRDVFYFLSPSKLTMQAFVLLFCVNITFLNFSFFLGYAKATEYWRGAFKTLAGIKIKKLLYKLFVKIVMFRISVQFC